jgi:hypothetical protein
VLASFPREHVLILQYERCRAGYEGELERTYRFLGLDPSNRPAGERNAPGDPRIRDLPQSERDRLAREYAPDVARLAQLAPEVDPALWNSVRGLL